MSDESDQMELIDKALGQLAEHFDSVHIFATRHLGPEGTEAYSKGRGNFYARFGQMVRFVENEKEGFREEIRKEDEP
jgi:hypothetical protein